jgi:hypothetical protein
MGVFMGYPEHFHGGNEGEHETLNANFGAEKIP